MLFLVFFFIFLSMTQRQNEGEVKKFFVFTTPRSAVQFLLLFRFAEHHFLLIFKVVNEARVAELFNSRKE